MHATDTAALKSLILPTTLMTRIPRTPRLRPPSPSPPLQTLLIAAVKSACFDRVKVWLWCHAGILASVAVASLDRGCRMCRIRPIHSHGAASDFFQRNRRNTVVVFNEYAATKGACGRFVCIPLQCLNKAIASLL